MKKTMLCILLSACVISLNNKVRIIPERVELTMMEPAIILGLDKAEDDEVQISILLDRIEENQSSDEGKEGTGTSETLSLVKASAKSLPMAVERMQKNSSKAVPGSSIEYFLMGESAYTNDNMAKYVDFLAKDNELRMTSKFYFVKGGDAYTAISRINKKNSSMGLDIFGENSGVSSISYKMSFVDFLVDLYGDIPDFAVPVLDLTEDGVYMNGYAVFKGFNFTGYLNSDIARGYNLVTNKSANSMLEIDMDGVVATLLIDTSYSFMDFKFNGDTLEKIIINTQLHTTIQDLQGGVSIKSYPTLTELREKANESIKNQVRQVVDFSQNSKADFLKINTQLAMQHPYKWHKMKGNWNELLPTIPVELSVMVFVERALDLIELR